VDPTSFPLTYYVIPAQAGIQKNAGSAGRAPSTTRRGGNMAKRFETTPRGLERTEMSGLLTVRRVPAKTDQEMETSLKATPD